MLTVPSPSMLHTQDRVRLIRLASKMFPGSPMRKAVLSGLARLRRASRELNIPGKHIFDNAQVQDDAEVYDDAEIQDNARAYGQAEIYDDAIVAGSAEVFGDAKVYGGSRVSGEARVYGQAEVYEDARVYQEAKVYGQAKVYGKAHVYGQSEVYGKASLSGEVKVFASSRVFDEAKISGKASLYHSLVFGQAQVSDSAVLTVDCKVYGHAKVRGNVKLGDDYVEPTRGVWVFESADLYGDAWVHHNASVYGNAKVYGKAEVSGNARIGGSAKVYGRAKIGGNAVILGGNWDGSEGKVLVGEWHSAEDFVKSIQNLETYDLDDSRGSNDKTVSDAVALRRFQEDLVEVLKELTRKYRLEDDISLNEIARIVGEKAKSSRKLSEFLGVYTRQRNGWQVLLETARGVFAFALTEKSPLFGALSDSNPRSLKDIPVWKSEFAAPDVRGGTDAISPKNRNEDEDQDQDQDQDMDFEEQRTPYLHIWQVLLEARDGGTPVSESRVRKELKLLGSDVSVRAVIQTLMQLYIYGKKPVIEKVTGGYQITQAAWDDIDKVDAEIRDRIGDLIF